MTNDVFIEGGEHILAPRFHEGEKLGCFPCKLVRCLNLSVDAINPSFLVQFEDGHKAGVFRREFRANGLGWTAIDIMQNDVETS